MRRFVAQQPTDWTCSKAALNKNEPTEKLTEIEIVDPRTGEKHVEIRRKGDEPHG